MDGRGRGRRSGKGFGVRVGDKGLADTAENAKIS